MATKTIYHIEIDHFERAGSGMGLTPGGKTSLIKPILYPVLSKDIYYTEETGGDTDSSIIKITGAQGAEVTLLKMIDNSIDNWDIYRKLFNGMTFTNSLIDYEFKSNGNKFLPEGYRFKISSYYHGAKVGGIAISFYNPDYQDGQSIHINNKVNDVYFENGTSYGGHGDFYSGVLGQGAFPAPYYDGFIYLVKEIKYYSVHFCNLNSYQTLTDSETGETTYYNPKLRYSIISAGYQDQGGSASEPFLIDGETVEIPAAYAIFAGGTKIDIQPDVKPGQSGGQSTSGSTSGSDWPYQYPAYGTGSAGGAGEGIFGGDGTHKKWGGSVTENDIIANNPDPVKSGDISSIWGLEHIENKGGVRIFDLSTDDLGTLYGKLWDNDFITSLNKYQAGNIGNTIIKLYQSKIAPEILGERKIYLGSFDSTIRTNQCKEYVHRKLGTFQVLEFFGSFLDYKTKLQIFLPFCGFQDLMADKYISPTHAPRTITVFIDADMVSGVAVYNVKTTYSDGQAIIDTFPFDFSRELPIIESSFANAQSAVNQILAGTVAVGTSALVGLFGPESMALGALTGFAGGAAQLGTGLGSLNRPTYTVSGGAGKNFGFLQADKIYLLAFRPVCTVPENSSHYIGYQSRITKKIGDIKKGTFNKMQSVLLDENIPSDIAGEIDNILTTGFYT